MLSTAIFQFKVTQNRYFSPFHIQRYYNISDYWIEWTSLIYLILYIPLIFPGSWFLDKMVKLYIEIFLLIKLNIIHNVYIGITMGGRSWCNSKPYRVMVKSDISATELIFSRIRWSKFGFCSTSKFKKNKN